MTTKTRPRVLIEDWLPIAAIGAECMRERGASSALPPLYFLHIWWARRPLTASRAAILASLLPAWSGQWPAALQKKFPTRESYQQWFLKLLGIFGDPVRARRLLAEARRQGVKIPNPYDSARAFTMNPAADQLATVRSLLEHAWGTSDLAVLDPMAGGGSIPFESLRYGLRTHANDLNPVAALVEKATLDYPFRFGPDLVKDIEKYGRQWCEAVQKRLAPYFSKIDDPNVEGVCYLWARTILCPETKKPIPLSPNWWIATGGKNLVCVRLVVKPNWDRCRFEIIEGKEAVEKANPDEGTIKRGTAVSPWTNQIVGGDYIKAEAQAGRMGQQLFLVARKRPGGFDFRLPTEGDEAVALAAQRALATSLEGPLAEFVPDEDLPFGRETHIKWPLGSYGIRRWQDFFSARQLLALGSALLELRQVQQRAQKDLPKDRAEAVGVYLAIAFDKACDYNSRMVRWDGTRNKVCNTFDRHDFSFKWSHAEFDASRNLFPWVVGQVTDAYAGIARLVHVDGQRPASAPISLTIGSGASVSIPTGTVALVCVDPPYYDNVIYSELSDFFYVWLKRSVGHLLPAIMAEPLTNKDDEAVANAARFVSVEDRAAREQGTKTKRTRKTTDGAKRPDDLARDDYERKMAATFREARRVLMPGGVLTVMFTHKRVEAWDALARSLIEAGFTIDSSWPITTESGASLHLANKSAASSTIVLACRKRERDTAGTWWDDVFQKKVAETVRLKAAEYEEQGILGVDLYLSTFGPVLHLISTAWPVKDPQGGEVIRPERALDLARQAVSEYRFEKLCTSYRLDLEPVTRWTVLAWDIFRAAEFPFDEARKLALAIAGDVQVEVKVGAKRKTTKNKDFLEGTIVAQTGVAEKSGESLKLVAPAQRVKNGHIDLEAETFEHPIDALHATIALHDQDGLGAAGKFLDKSGMARDKAFLGAFEALLHAIPPVRPEWRALEAVRQAHLTKKVKAPPQPENLELFAVATAGAEADDEGAESDEAEA